MEHEIKIFERPEMENPVYKLRIFNRDVCSEHFIQRINNNDFDIWYEVLKENDVWTSGQDQEKFLGFTKKSAVQELINKVQNINKVK